MSPSRKKAERSATGRQRRDARTTAEWALFAVAALIVLAVVSVLLLDWLNGATDPPAFRATPGEVVAAAGSHRVPVEVENTGGQAAAEVVVTAELEVGGELVEAEETVDFLAGGERTEVTFLFQEDPAAGRLTVHVTSYREP